MRPAPAGPLGIALASISAAGIAHAQSSRPAVDDYDRRFVLALEGDAEIDLTHGQPAFGVGASLEIHVVENWLEIEVGAGLLAGDGGFEIPFDIVFKKPWQLTRWAEIMVGGGPALVINRGTSRDGVFFGGEAIVDVMFWPSRHVGFGVEPGVEAVYLGNSFEYSLGITTGLLLGC